MTWRSPVVIIGMDAATWDVMNPLMASGQLPNISRLMSEGTWGPLQSNLHYSSPSLWTSISTGKSPEKHGVLGFYGATRHHRKVPTIYEILDNGEGKIGLFRWFGTWPPVKNKGFTVPSSIARSSETYPPNLRFANGLVHPTNLSDYINGGLQYARHGAKLSTLFEAISELIYEAVTRPERREWLYRRQLLEASIYADIFAYLLRRYRPQVGAILFSVIDSFGHQYWKYREPELFDNVTELEARKYGDVIDRAYIAVDRSLGIILRTLPGDALIVVVSDHGQRAGPPLNRPFLMSENLIKLLGFHKRVWKTDLGYKSVFQSQSESGKDQNLNELKDNLISIKLLEGDRSVFEINDQAANGFEVQVSLDGIVNLESEVLLPNDRIVRLSDIIFSRKVSGVHAERGIIILRGPGIKRGHKAEGGTIFDVTPTILALRGKPVGRDMDGQVIIDAIEESFLRRNPIRFLESHGIEKNKEDDLSLTDEEREKLEAKLRDLGYL